MRRKAALLPVVLTAVALAACGGGASSNGVASDTPAQILQAAVSSLRAAHSVRISGTVGSGPSAITIDAVAFSNGDIDGTIGQGGATARVVKVGSTDYLNGSKQFWTTMGSAPASVAAKLAGRWVSIPDGQGSVGIGSTFTMSALATSLLQDNGTITKGTSGTVDGQAAVSIKSSKGGVLWVATTGTPYILEVVGTGAGQNSGQVTFSAWDQGTAPSPPAGAVPASSFGGSSGGTISTVPGSGTTGAGVTGATGSTGTGPTGTTGSGPTGTTGSGPTGTTGSGPTGTGTSGATSST